MELQAQLTALEEEVGILKGEIKAILQEVRVAVLARQNPFLSDDLGRPAPIPASLTNPDSGDAPAVPMPSEAIEPADAPAPMVSATSRVARLSAEESEEPDSHTPTAGRARRPIDLAALMVWVQESAENFSHTEFVMLVTMASYAEFFDEGLKDTLIEMSEQVQRDLTTRASMADFSLALKKLESINATTGRRRQAA